LHWNFGLYRVRHGAAGNFKPTVGLPPTIRTEKGIEMNAVRTELQKQQRVQRAKLAKLQQEIADGRPPALPHGKQEIFEWHPTIPDFAARIYRSGRGVWRLGYRTKAGEKRTETLGNMAVLPLSFAEKKARTLLQEVMHGRDPQAERRKLRLRPQRTVGQLCEEYFDEMMGRPEMSVRTIKGYRSVAKWYLDILRNMHFAELTAQDVATRVREISKQRSGDELATARRLSRASISAPLTIRSCHAQKRAA
jgi:hypothetical protein